ncbi:hypothetical protein Cni_G15825 [Canna indica]|uniref:Uncharacterized protein n=1 Tax=Canna indica TaxID=4628 RepID=A0AAQ3KE36_9LILI|nr:hypothetical protein Cni_G15825 [Canna indica]
MILDGLKQLADANRSTYATTKRAIMTAQHWAILGGGTERSIGLAELERLTGNMLYGEIQSMDEVDEWAARIHEIHKSQTQKTLTELRQLLAMAYLQKARIEQSAVTDSFMADLLQPLTFHIKNLEACHKMINSSANSNSYCPVHFMDL